MTDQADSSTPMYEDQPESQDESLISVIIGNNAANSAQMDDSAPQSDPLESIDVLEEQPMVVSRVELLTAAIENHPDAPANYVFRGEILLDGKDYDLAAEDFKKALELAEDQAETSNWGYIYRALADRAREGLRRSGF